jgi:hypothetical protein
MADNVTAPATGIVFASDDIGGVQYPYAKLAFGADNSAVPVADANGARLPVLIGGTLPAFAATPTVNIGTAPTITVAGPLTDAQLRATALPVSFSGQSVGITGTPTFNIGTAPTLTVAGTGTFAISAAALPLPTGAATSAAQTTTNASLASIDGKFAALESGRVPVAAQRLATTTRTYDFASGQRITTAGAGQVRSTAVAATEVLLHASVRGFFRVGDSAVAATVGAGSIPLAADEKFHLQITSGQFVSFIRDGASDGSLSIVPVA